MTEGKLIVVTAPSGAGKTSIVRYMLSQDASLAFSVSATTRSQRANETDGVDYYFITAESFREKLASGDFLEWQEVYENQYYGTLKSEIERLWSKGCHVLFDIDVKGAVNIKNAYGDRALTIFVKPPSEEILIERLRNRNTEDEDSLRKRIARVKEEMTYESRFDRVVVNDVLDVAREQALDMVQTFIKQH